MRQIPTCKKCGHEHWNMKPCVTESRSDSGPQIIFFRPREGQREGNTHLDSVVHVGGNTFGQKRKPLHSETS